MLTASVCSIKTAHEVAGHPTNSMFMGQVYLPHTRVCCVYLVSSIVPVISTELFPLSCMYFISINSSSFRPSSSVSTPLLLALASFWSPDLASLLMLPSPLHPPLLGDSSPTTEYRVRHVPRTWQPTDTTSAQTSTRGQNLGFI